MAQPSAHAAVVCIDVLYMNSTTHALARLHIDVLVGDAATPGERAIGRVPIRHEQGVRRQRWRQVQDELGGSDGTASGRGIDGPAAAVARHENAHLLV